MFLPVEQRTSYADGILKGGEHSMINMEKRFQTRNAEHMKSTYGDGEGSLSREAERICTQALSRPTLLTVKQFCQQHPAFSQGGLRWLLFHRQANGLDRAIVKVGRRVLIDVDQFFCWLAQQNGR